LAKGLTDVAPCVVGVCYAQARVASIPTSLINAEHDPDGRRVWNQEAVEFQLAHVDYSVRARYDRDPLWGERVRLMQHWADKLETLRKGAEVIPLGPRSRKA
jgi:hypothetical protein